jgi:hypothetical protein
MLKKFKCLIMLASFLMLTSGVAFAGLRGAIYTVAVNYNVTGSSTTAYVNVANAEYIGAWIICTSAAGAPSLTVKAEMSYDKTTGNFVTPDGMSDIFTDRTAETAFVKRVSCPPMKYIRFNLNNGGGNADTLVTVILFVQFLN